MKYIATMPYNSRNLSESGDLDPARAVAIEMHDQLPKTILIATTNPAKQTIYLQPLIELDVEKDNGYQRIMSLADIENMNGYLRVVKNNLAIQEPEENAPTAKGNAMEKAKGYAMQMVERYSKFTNPPGMIIAVDDDLKIYKKDWRNLAPKKIQAGGAIRAVDEGQRTNNSMDIAKHYCGLVREHGYMLPNKEMVLNVKFTYAIAVAIWDENIEDYRYIEYEHIVDGYLLKFNDELYYDKYPLIWRPILEEDTNMSTGRAVEIAEEGNREKVNEIFGPLLGFIEENIVN